MNETIEKKCIAKGVKLTDQRKIIAKVMSESNDHPDVDELYNRVSKIDSKISIYGYYSDQIDDNDYHILLKLLKEDRLTKNFIQPKYLN